MSRFWREEWPLLVASWSGIVLLAVGYLIFGRAFALGGAFVSVWLVLSGRWFMYLDERRVARGGRDSPS